ncbi:MAG: VTT domain-containing protein [Parvularculaceae bacterium]|nr:TVP38/TMEM64 family protein [Parvularculaceae bacterium]
MTAPARPRPALARFLPLALILAAAAAIFATGAHRYLTLEALKDHRAGLEALVDKNLPVALALFALAYIAVAALSLPGATIMSLLGGFLFGPLIGTAAVVVAATIGATIIFMAAKTALGDSLKRRAGPFARKMEEGFKDNAFSYLLLLRLIPLFPFFIVNIAPSFFNIRMRTFAAATFIGIIPGAFAFVSAGAGLGAVLDAGEDVKLTGLLTQPAVLTPIIALSLLAMLPIAAKKMGWVKSSGAERNS